MTPLPRINNLKIKYTLIKVKTICPALILAAKRKDKVIGRTIILTVSIKIKNGFNQLGAPDGRRDASTLLKE